MNEKPKDVSRKRWKINRLRWICLNVDWLKFLMIKTF